MKKWRKSLACVAMAIMMMAAVLVQSQPVYAEESTETSSGSTDTTSIVNNSTVTPAGSTGSAYVCLGDTYQTQTVSAGQQVTLVLPIVNYCFCPITNVVITPQTSNLVTAWPFEPSATGYTKNVPYISAYTSGADANQTRADVTYNFKVRDDVMTGYYPLNFDITYLENGEAQSTTTVTAFINTKGKAGSGYLEENTGSGTASKPRIIVTGFETDPEKVCAGDTFTLTVHIKNTSQQTAVSNVLFDLQAGEETTGTSSTTGTTAVTSASFLPTSGSSSIYEDTISAGQTKDLKIEMTARADLTQKPYVLNVNMTYDSAKDVDIKDTASVSIPIYQASRFDTGEEEIMPSDIMTGDQANVSFSLYNTGKTTLYNVWVRYKSDCVEGEDVYVGTITSGATGYVDSMVTGVAANDGTVMMEISYEDEAGNVTTQEKEINLFISEMSTEYMEMSPDDMMMDDMTEDTGKSVPVVPIVLIVIVAAVVVLIVVLRMRKKKKGAAAERDELQELEDELSEMTDEDEANDGK